jgi:uncharacterized protein YukE
MSRPAGEPGAVGAGARSMSAAAEALREARAGLRGATSFVVVAGAWRGPASEAFRIDGAGLHTHLDQAAGALDQAAGALAELAARLEHAQATWERARHLAASAGTELDPQGGILSPSGGIDTIALPVAGQAVRLAAAADHEAAAARRTAAARLDHAATLVPARRASATPHGPAHGGAVSGGVSPHRPLPAGTGHGTGAGHDGDGHPVRRAAARALEAGAEVAKATHHLAAGAEARVRAAGRLAATADDPAVRSAAARVVDTAGRPLLDGRVLHALPLIAPVLDFSAGLSEGQPLPRALAGAVGGAVGADIGGRVGLAVCGGQAAATQGVGVVICPALTAVGGAVGAHAGKEVALHLYDKLAGPPGPPPSPRSSP